MSVLNVALEPNRVRLQTDTLQWDMSTGEPHSLTKRKAEISENGRFVVAHRGGVLWGKHMFRSILARDTLEKAMLQARALHDVMTPEMLGRNDGDHLVLAGFDHGQGRARAWSMMRSSDRQECCELQPGLHLNPREPVGVKLRDGGDLSDERFMLHARAQQLFGRRMKGGPGTTLCIGGVAVLHVCTAEGVVERELGLYPDHAEQAARFGCPRRGLAPAKAREVMTA